LSGTPYSGLEFPKVWDLNVPPVGSTGCDCMWAGGALVNNEWVLGQPESSGCAHAPIGFGGGGGCAGYWGRPYAISGCTHPVTGENLVIVSQSPMWVGPGTCPPPSGCMDPTPTYSFESLPVIQRPHWMLQVVYDAFSQSLVFTLAGTVIYANTNPPSPGCFAFTSSNTWTSTVPLSGYSTGDPVVLSSGTSSCLDPDAGFIPMPTSVTLS